MRQESVLIEGIALSGYRCFWGEPQRLGPLSKINILIGQNNSGKSNVLRFLKRHYGSALGEAHSSSGALEIRELDWPLGDSSRVFTVGFGLPVGSERHTHLLEKLSGRFKNEKLVRFVDAVIRSLPLTHGSPVCWFDFERRQGGQLAPSGSLVDSLLAEDSLPQGSWHVVCSRLTNQAGGEVKQSVTQTLAELSKLSFSPADVEMISAFRQIGPEDPDSNEFDGKGLIDRLARLQNPAHDEQALREQFSSINQFLREVTGCHSAELEVPHDRGTLTVHMEGRSLPLPSLGTGIHEVVILAAAATVFSDRVLCIEEPELHLHPSLQRKLVRYLGEKTRNQYFISTHAAHILDTPGTTVFHVRSEKGRSLVELACSDIDRSGICHDLGYRASDLLQTNSLIWVEGPSDRIYLSHWLRHSAPDLIEGLHYSIMFYGGRLLSHLSVNDPDVDDFISLRPSLPT